MNNKGHILLLLTFFVAVPLSLSAQSISYLDQILERGEQMVSEGEISRALDLWGSEVVDSESELTDPRIGCRIIELATENNLEEYYELGQRAYFWGLSNPSSPHFARELEQELERLEPISDPELLERWEAYIRDEDYSKMGASIERFWKSVDPTFETDYNERLIEHWSRISYARETFTKNNSTIYGTDDRGTIYVRFGEPDVKKSGQMNYNSSFVRFWISDAFESTIDAMQDEFLGEDDSTSADIQRSIRQSQLARSQLVTNLEREIRVSHSYPNYEIWVYEEMISDQNENLIYIFGDDGTSGSFGLKRSLDELIPSSSFRPVRLGMNIPPSFFLQLMYYQEVINVDFYFANAFQDLENIIYRSSGINRFDSQLQRTRNTTRLRSKQLKAPEQRSSIVHNMPQIPVDVYQYRLLDETNRPYLATFLHSRPHQAFYFDQVRQNIFEDSEYYYEAFAVTMNEEKEIFYRDNTPPRRIVIDSDFRGNINNYEPHITYFPVPNNTDYAAQRFSIEMHHGNMDRDRIGEQFFPEDLRAIGIATAEQIEPLSTESDRLEMGDLIIGVEGDGEFTEPFGFRVEPDASIPTGESLMLHLEIYHLEGSDSDPVPFQIEYSVRANKNIFQRIFGSRDQISLELNFESRGSTFRENLEIDTTPFDPGTYTLELVVSQAGRDEEIERTIDFDIE